ncbi:MAG TPA: FAD binding domain-containing protein [Negativicutes bacterium]|nr:FAD binding domain-containing protein [Negativicutes bacterium]
MRELQVSIPENKEALKEALAEAEGKYLMVAGGTDLLVDFSEKLHGCEILIDLSGVRELAYIDDNEDCLAIGAGTTFAKLAESAAVQKHARCLSQASGLVGSPQIRNRATIGGNVANCSPAADSIPGLLALDASVMLVFSNGEERLLPLQELLSKEAGWMAREKAFIDSFIIPKKGCTTRSGFARIGSRRTVTISKLSLAIAIDLDDKEEIIEARVSLGAVGRTAYRSIAAEGLLKGRSFSEAERQVLAAELGTALSREISERLAGRASTPYKRQAVIGLVQDLLIEREI